jgi:hypothetical protein
MEAHQRSGLVDELNRQSLPRFAPEQISSSSFFNHPRGLFVFFAVPDLSAHGVVNGALPHSPAVSSDRSLRICLVARAATTGSVLQTAVPSQAPASSSVKARPRLHQRYRFERQTLRARVMFSV